MISSNGGRRKNRREKQDSREIFNNFIKINEKAPWCGNTIGAKLYSFLNLYIQYKRCMAESQGNKGVSIPSLHSIKLLTLRQGKG